MTGGELTAAWLVGILCVTGAVSSMVKAWAAARRETARSQEAVALAYLQAQQATVEAQHGWLTVPETWSKDGGL
ncbi:hypothetical protein OG455_41675 [Kitasatospora sp. NBC_01287]|uniref:hypothetical protein n=1 Tax=Kitasatospora sp. NBC_01287 TaxID=2903573 RepID=UPI002259B77C|nr:hypothetical protein [Kitasatospora sp. NBC_01287]MCX4751754.1 hypothetical protein [Kitasatospora sp. NBC_01287]MCX4751954.1 hypothetical protein [Kitasatospora sp. NBC_01287]